MSRRPPTQRHHPSHWDPFCHRLGEANQKNSEVNKRLLFDTVKGCADALEAWQRLAKLPLLANREASFRPQDGVEVCTPPSSPDHSLESRLWSHIRRPQLFPYHSLSSIPCQDHGFILDCGFIS